MNLSFHDYLARVAGAVVSKRLYVRQIHNFTDLDMKWFQITKGIWTKIAQNVCDHYVLDLVILWCDNGKLKHVSMGVTA